MKSFYKLILSTLVVFCFTAVQAQEDTKVGGEKKDAAPKTTGDIMIKEEGVAGTPNKTAPSKSVVKPKPKMTPKEKKKTRRANNKKKKQAKNKTPGAFLAPFTDPSGSS